VKLDQSRLEYYIAPVQAAKQLGLDLDSIYQLADEGKLQAAVMTDGSIGIRQISVSNLLPKEALPEYQLNPGLKGMPISINEAGRKYKLDTSTFTHWMMWCMPNGVKEPWTRSISCQSCMVERCMMVGKATSATNAPAPVSGGHCRAHGCIRKRLHSTLSKSIGVRNKGGRVH
jgi:hypothetical protein